MENSVQVERKEITAEWLNSKFGQTFPGRLSQILGNRVWNIGALNIISEYGSFSVSTTSSHGEVNSDDTLFSIKYIDQVETLVALIKDCEGE